MVFSPVLFYFVLLYFDLLYFDSFIKAFFIPDLSRAH